MWMGLSRNVAKILGGIIARYQEVCGIIIYAYSIVSDHYHLLLRAPLGNIDEFEENINREIARRINRINRRKGKFWARRYDDERVLEEEDLLEGLLYVVTNPVKHGLTTDLNVWTALNSYKQCLDGADRKFSFTEYSAQDGPRVVSHQLKLTPLPQFADMSQDEREKEIERLIMERTAALLAERKEQGKKIIPRTMVPDPDPGSVPREVASSPRPCCYTISPQRRKEYRALLRLRQERYDYASMHYRLGKLDVDFPEFSFKPPLHRKPRLFPFQLISPENLDIRKPQA